MSESEYTAISKIPLLELHSVPLATLFEYLADKNPREQERVLELRSAALKMRGSNVKH